MKNWNHLLIFFLFVLFELIGMNSYCQTIEELDSLRTFENSRKNYKEALSYSKSLLKLSELKYGQESEEYFKYLNKWSKTLYNYSNTKVKDLSLFTKAIDSLNSAHNSNAYFDFIEFNSINILLSRAYFNSYKTASLNERKEKIYSKIDSVLEITINRLHNCERSERKYLYLGDAFFWKGLTFRELRFKKDKIEITNKDAFVKSSESFMNSIKYYGNVKNDIELKKEALKFSVFAYYTLGDNLFFHLEDEKKGFSVYQNGYNFYIQNRDLIDKNYAKNLLSKYGDSLRRINDLDKSELIFQELLSIYADHEKKSEYNYSQQLWRYSQTLIKAKKNLLALEKLNEAESLLQKQGPSEYGTIYLARTLKSKAEIYLELNKKKDAEKFFKKSYDIVSSAHGKKYSLEKRPLYIEYLIGIAKLNKSKGNLNNAEKLFNQALYLADVDSIWNQSSSYISSRIAVYRDLILIAQEKKNTIALDKYCLQLNLLRKRALKDRFAYICERQKNELIKEEKSLSDLIHNLTLWNFKNRPEGILKSYEEELFLKGLVLDDYIEYISKLKAKDDMETNELIYTWKRKKESLDNFVISRKSDSTYLDSLQNEIESIERSLSNTFSKSKRAFENFSVNAKDVYSQLSGDEAILEFIHFDIIRDGEKTDSTLYAALIIKKDSLRNKFIPLFFESELDKILKKEKTRKRDYAERLYGTAQTKGFEGIRQPNFFYEKIGKKLHPEIKDSKRIYFSTSGSLNRINVGAIKFENKSAFFDKFEMIQLGNTKKISQEKSKDYRNTEWVLIGGVDYGGSEENRFAEDRGSSGLWFDLEYSQVEVNEISKLLDTKNHRLIQGEQAVEKSIYNLDKGSFSPRVLHLSTHGYFFERNYSGLAKNSVYAVVDDPMLRSGLIMANANDSWTAEHTISSAREDGVLTAQEIGDLDLSNTELVVLSACETGLGEIKGNEGVFGLQRAFKKAGVKYILMTLWQVPDFQTKEFMTNFYTNLIAEEMPIREAFQQAQRNFKQLHPEDPYLWAGFILIE